MPGLNENPLHLSALAPEFLLYARAELSLSLQTIQKYEDCLRQVGRMIGDRDVRDYAKADVTMLKAGMLAKQHSVGRQVGILAAFKGLLRYCLRERNIDVLDPDYISFPKRPRRTVVFLTPEEVERFVSVISLERAAGGPLIRGLRFRALVEVLLGSGMRIGEALSLDRRDIDYKKREASIVGKGDKQRVVFFTERALRWIEAYLAVRSDAHAALFVSMDGQSRLKRTDIWRLFARHREMAGIDKRVTPHLLRHTAATQLLFNGCPIGHIKEILGHERLETTCRYYLGLDQRAAKEAHQKYLVFPIGRGGPARLTIEISQSTRRRLSLELFRLFWCARQRHHEPAMTLHELLFQIINQAIAGIICDGLIRCVRRGRTRIRFRSMSRLSPRIPRWRSYQHLRHRSRRTTHWR